MTQPESSTSVSAPAVPAQPGPPVVPAQAVPPPVSPVPPPVAEAPARVATAPPLQAPVVPGQRTPAGSERTEPWPYPFGPPPPAPPRGGPGWQRVLLSVFIAASLLLALAAAASAGLAARRAAAIAPAATWVDAMRPEVRGAAIRALLARRVEAVRAKDRAAFLGDVSTADPVFVKRQEVLFNNLTRLPLGEFGMELEDGPAYDHLIDSSLSGRYQSLVQAAGVTVRYRIDGIDGKPVAVPWAPVFGFDSGRWMLVSELVDSALPYGVSGQPWDGGAITVLRTDRVVGVFSAEDTERAKPLMAAAEASLSKVLKIRPTGWDGKVLLTAVQDQRIFDAYFGDSPDRVAEVAAIAVPYYDRVTAWHQAAQYATTRVVFNPRELSAEADELEHDLVHEITHAAFGPITSGYTPRWLVEGFAEYVAYKGQNIAPRAIAEAIQGEDVGKGLPPDGEFYANARNYHTSWLACRMLAERYGERKLLAYYEAFVGTADADTNARRVFGVGLPALTAQWQAYVARIRR